MIIHYEIVWADGSKDEGQLSAKLSYTSIIDLSALPEPQSYVYLYSHFMAGIYLWYGYCGKITKVQMEA